MTNLLTILTELSRPSVRSIRKNITDQNCGIGKILIASVYTINISEEPSFATSFILLLVTSLMYPRYMKTTAPDKKLDIKLTVTVISESLNLKILKKLDL
jgi:hypothetical protein